MGGIGLRIVRLLLNRGAWSLALSLGNQAREPCIILNAFKLLTSYDSRKPAGEHGLSSVLQVVSHVQLSAHWVESIGMELTAWSSWLL